MCTHQTDVSPRTQFFSERPRVLCLILLSLFVTAFLIRMFQITEPMSASAQREFRGALIARAYYLQSSSSVPEWRKRVAQINKDAESVGEPPILELLASIGYWFCGAEVLWLPRLLSSLFWLVGGFFLWKLARWLFYLDAAVFSTSFYLLVPPGVRETRRFQPDPFMVMLVLCGIWLIVRQLERPSSFRLVLIGASLTLAGLMKPPCLLLPLAVLTALWFLKDAGRPRSIGLLTALLLPLIVVLVYYELILARSPFIQEVARETLLLSWLFYPFFWKGWFTAAASMVGGYPALTGAFLGILLLPKGTARTLLIGLWLGYLGFGMVFTYQIHTHPYYHLLLIPIVSLCLGPLGGLVLNVLGRPSFGILHRLSVYAVLFLTVFVTFASYVREYVHPAMLALEKASPVQFNENLRARQATRNPLKFLAYLLEPTTICPVLEGCTTNVATAKAIGDRVSHSTRLIILDPDDISLRYYGELYGEPWPTLEIQRLDQALGKPSALLPAAERFLTLINNKKISPEYFIVADLAELEAQKELKELLIRNFPILVKNDDYWIFDLRASGYPTK